MRSWVWTFHLSLFLYLSLSPSHVLTPSQMFCSSVFLFSSLFHSHFPSLSPSLPLSLSLSHPLSPLALSLSLFLSLSATLLFLIHLNRRLWAGSGQRWQRGVCVR